MTQDAVTKRGPGRPRGSSAQETRERLITVARSHFAKSGFAGASLRAIGAEAGVDASLIRYHFGDKSGLLLATMELPVNPAEILQKVIAQGPEGMGERLVRAFLTSWDPHAEVFSAMIRTALTSGDPQQAPGLQVAQQIVIAALRQVLDGDDRLLRAELIAAQIIGMALLRYVVQLAPLASASIDEVVAIYGPAIQAAVDRS